MPDTPPACRQCGDRLPPPPYEWDLCPPCRRGELGQARARLEQATAGGAPGSMLREVGEAMLKALDWRMHDGRLTWVHTCGYEVPEDIVALEGLPNPCPGCGS